MHAQFTSTSFSVAVCVTIFTLLVACGDSDAPSAPQPASSAESEADAVPASSSQTEYVIIESCSSDLKSPDSWDMFGGSSGQDSPEWSSATSSSEAVPVSSSSGHLSHALSSPTEPQAGSSSSAELASSSTIVEASPEIVLDKDGFATVADVYKGLKPDEKAVFIIRHS